MAQSSAGPFKALRASASPACSDGSGLNFTKAMSDKLSYYSFTVKGTYPNGNRAKMSGHLKDTPGYPNSAFTKAVEACKEVTPDLIVDLSVPGNVVLKQLKGKPKR